MTMTLDEVAEQIGLAPATIKNRRARGEFAWLKSDGRGLYADVQDVADWVERRRREVNAALGLGSQSAPVQPARSRRRSG
ncbi:helix-turn-helix transcriptional regulator [Roseateles chitosanitabidus]|uniref:helix-turn-helix transcriptional regulator n=1 Tax=Roseateles chitosanitabidus TaxID=65048 RepID=UPI00235607F5|nr:hypothetical protein [Roseateles chitosanitabidus]